MAPEDRRGNPVSRPKQLATFLLFGGLAALVNLLAGWQLYGTGLFPDLPYWAATATAAALGLVVNFGLNYTFNFKFRDRSAWAQFSTFCIVSLLGIVITSALSQGLLSVITLCAGTAFHLGTLEVRSTLAAHVGAVGLTVLYSFPAHKFLSFNTGIRAQFRQACAQLWEPA
jgi:putative flippase GtrA